MNWENTTPTWDDLPSAEIPTELLEGLERLSEDATFIKLRLRWRPRGTEATSFLTKDRLLDLREEPTTKVAAAVAAYAAHFYGEGQCSNKFEAQVHRELHDPPEGVAKREWRSITFYIGQDEEATCESEDDELVCEDEPGDFDDNVVPFERPRHLRSYRSSWESSRASFPEGYEKYAGLIEFSRSDPTGFAMMVMQQANERVVDIMQQTSERSVQILEDQLSRSVDRLDQMMSRQMSSIHHINEGLQTITQGAGKIAGLGVELFESGLEKQAQYARMEYETEVGKERTELARDAVKQGSTLLQAVVMANAAKERVRAQPARQGQAPPSTSRAAPSASTSRGAPSASASGVVPSAGTSRGAASAKATDETSSSETDHELVEQAERLLALATDEVRERLREVAPSLAAVFNGLGEGPLSAAMVRKVVADAGQTVDRLELVKAGMLLEPALAEALSGLLMRVSSNDML
jgi:hypothetical protein